MSNQKFTLPELGWRPFLQQQVTLEELETGFAARVDAVYRDQLHISTTTGGRQIGLSGTMAAKDTEFRPTTGDWLWMEQGTDRPLRLLDRINLLQRTAAGTNAYTQLIAANIDTLFIVSSCNKDFNLSRLERYLSLVMAADITSVILLTKADLTDNADQYIEQAQRLHRDVPVLKVDALQGDIPKLLSPWTGTGQTIAFLGSSGVGKSTLTNALLGQQRQATQGIREDDAKGRHTTTDRCMFRIPDGGWVLDTPGMRELRLNDDAAGVSALFSDIEELMTGCKFNNCRHSGDRGCAVEAAIESGNLELRRWQSYRKLQAEADQASQTKFERKKAREKWGKDISRHIRQYKKLKLEG